MATGVSAVSRALHVTHRIARYAVLPVVHLCASTAGISGSIAGRREQFSDYVSQWNTEHQRRLGTPPVYEFEQAQCGEKFTATTFYLDQQFTGEEALGKQPAKENAAHLAIESVSSQPISRPVQDPDYISQWNTVHQRRLGTPAVFEVKQGQSGQDFVATTYFQDQQFTGHYAVGKQRAKDNAAQLALQSIAADPRYPFQDLHALIPIPKPIHCKPSDFSPEQLSGLDQQLRHQIALVTNDCNSPQLMEAVILQYALDHQAVIPNLRDYPYVCAYEWYAGPDGHSHEGKGDVVLCKPSGREFLVVEVKHVASPSSSRDKSRQEKRREVEKQALIYGKKWYARCPWADDVKAMILTEETFDGLKTPDGDDLGDRFQDFVNRTLAECRQQELQQHQQP